MKNIQISTARLLLREYSEGDFCGVHEYAKDPEVTHFMTWGPNTPEDTRNFIRQAISQQATLPRLSYHFAVTLNDSGQIIGGCGIHIREPDQRGDDRRARAG